MKKENVNIPQLDESSSFNVIYVDSTSHISLCDHENIEIFSRKDEDIHFILENIKHNQELNLEAKYYLLGLENDIGLLETCNKCKITSSSIPNDRKNFIFDVGDSALYSKEYFLDGNNQVIKVTFKADNQRIDPFLLCFKCSASHFKQKCKFQLSFSSESKNFVFVIDIKMNPKRSHDEACKSEDDPISVSNMKTKEEECSKLKDYIAKISFKDFEHVRDCVQERGGITNVLDS